MADGYKWTIGLGSDQLGYHVPISNFRVLCLGDEFIGAGTCQSVFEEGLIEFPDSVGGATCKRIAEHPSPDDAFVVIASCKYGQAFGEAQGHYEETNSAGWDLAEDMLSAVAAITGNDDATDVNPDFPDGGRASSRRATCPDPVTDPHGGETPGLLSWRPSSRSASDRRRLRGRCPTALSPVSARVKPRLRESTSRASPSCGERSRTRATRPSAS